MGRAASGKVFLAALLVALVAADGAKEGDNASTVDNTAFWLLAVLCVGLGLILILGSYCARDAPRVAVPRTRLTSQLTFVTAGWLTVLRRRGKDVITGRVDTTSTTA